MSAHYCNACKLKLGFDNGLSGVHECRAYDKPIPGFPSYPKKHLPISELKLGDVVALTDDIKMADFMTGVVTKVTKDLVTIYRPYATTDNVEYTGGLTATMGAEMCTYFRDDKRTLYVYSRKVTV